MGLPFIFSFKLFIMNKINKKFKGTEENENISSESQKTHYKGKAITSIKANNEITMEGTREINKAKIIDILKEDKDNGDHGLSSGCFARIIGTDPGSVTAAVKELRDNNIIEIVNQERRPYFFRSRHIYKLSGTGGKIQSEVSEAV